MHQQPGPQEPDRRLGNPAQSAYYRPPGNARPPSPQPARKGNHAGTCFIFGALAVLAGIFAPKLPV